MATIFKLDIDSKNVFKRLETTERIDKIISMLGLTLRNLNYKETAKGYHYYIEVENDLSDMEVCLIQSLMGSDYSRETFNYLRIRQGIKDWNVLFQKKYRNNKLVSEEK